MSNVWKIGCRWSENGTRESSIISVFRRNNVVFLGTEIDRFEKEVKSGDYFAIANGHTVVAVAKAIDNPKKLSEFTIKTNESEEVYFKYVDCKDWVLGVKVHIVDLDKENQIKYKKMGTFFAANQIWNEVKDKYENQNKRFSIKSFTYSLKQITIKSGSSEIKSILGSNTKYIIPIYQRPYSWTEKELEPFINDIFNGYWGIEKDTGSQEPMFIGTMQLSEKKFISTTEHEQEVIDGQQRLSSMLLLLKYLSIAYPETEKLIDQKFSWLETRVNNGEQLKSLNQLLVATELGENQHEINPYLRNARIIKLLFEQNIIGESETALSFDVNDFCDYLFTKVYFVVIETYAGLSKTIQIFNAINTTGLDLNAEDLFKIRMYEYLTEKQHYDDSAFDKISKLYELVEQNNKSRNDNITSMRDVLDIYKDYLISKYDLPNVLYSYATDTFYERLFDSILDVKKWEQFKNLKGIELSLDEIKDIILVRFEWNDLVYDSAHGMFALNLIRWSRYSRYWRIVYLLMYLQKDLPKEQRNANISTLLISLNKLFFIYSIFYAKAVNEVHSFMQNLYKTLTNNSLEFVINKINEKTINWNNDSIKAVLSGHITDNAKKKNLICLFSSFLEEDIKHSNIADLHKKLFKTDFDIEHIQAYHDVEESKRQQIWEQWGHEINSLGNLVILEQEINRSISNKPYYEKILKYPESKFEIIKKQVNEYPTWDLEKCKLRKEKEVNKILNYLFSL